MTPPPPGPSARSTPGAAGHPTATPQPRPTCLLNYTKCLWILERVYKTNLVTSKLIWFWTCKTTIDLLWFMMSIPNCCRLMLAMSGGNSVHVYRRAAAIAISRLSRADHCAVPTSGYGPHWPALELCLITLDSQWLTTYVYLFIQVFLPIRIRWIMNLDPSLADAVRQSPKYTEGALSERSTVARERSQLLSLLWLETLKILTAAVWAGAHANCRDKINESKRNMKQRNKRYFKKNDRTSEWNSCIAGGITNLLRCCIRGSHKRFSCAGIKTAPRRAQWLYLWSTLW